MTAELLAAKILRILASTHPSTAWETYARLKLTGYEVSYPQTVAALREALQKQRVEIVTQADCTEESFKITPVGLRILRCSSKVDEVAEVIKSS